MAYVTRPAKINHMSAKNVHGYLLYHNLIIYTNAIKSLPVLQSLMSFLLQFTEMGYYV